MPDKHERVAGEIWDELHWAAPDYAVDPLEVAETQRNIAAILRREYGEDG